MPLTKVTGGEIDNNSSIIVDSYSVTGIATFSNGPVLIGTATSTGTASQKLQVTGGAYVSGNTGIGTNNPQTKLEIGGVLGFTGSNIKIGDSNTGSSITSGSQNFFAGNNAGQSNTIGGNNNFIGYRAGVSNITGGDNNFFGYLAGTNNNSGTGNNFFGYLAGTGNTTGDYNIFVGGYAGNTNQNGSQNIVIGYNQQAPILNGSNQLVIGAGSTAWIVGNSSYNIGIGTINPTSKLHVVAGAGAGAVNFRVAAPDNHIFRLSRIAPAANTGNVDLQVTSYGAGSLIADNTLNLQSGTSAPIIFYTSGFNERVRIDSSGNLGIGTNAPVVPLDLAVSSAVQRIYSTTGTNGAYTQYRNTGGFGYFGLDSSTGSSFGVPYGLHIYHSGAYPIVFSNNGGLERARFDSNGNLGIGTTNPTSKLEVLGGPGGGAGQLRLRTSGDVGIANTTVFLRLNDVNGNAGYFGFGGTANQLDIWNYKNGDIKLGTNGTERVCITSTGNLGVGITNPTSKLQVVGSTDLNKLNLSGISSSISSTAVDVFVYDTRKDSDGGAWRKRTQNTSWYNETLNTATRGSRKDFPAVAVIVATQNDVTIYDGDDPDMPMWMVFTNVGDVVLNWATSGGSIPTSLFLLNGILSIATSVSGVLLFNFVKDDIKLCYFTNPYSLTTGRLITNRNNSNNVGWTASGDGYIIVNNIINDVAMTVLPNAPIDAATGLPIPTIAVATQQGISIITDSGTVYNLTPESDPAYASIKNFFSVGFDSNQKLFFTDTQTGSGYSQLIYLPNYNYNQSLSDTYSSLSGSYNYEWGGEARLTATRIGYWNVSNTSRLIKKSVGTKDSIAIGYIGSGLGGNGLSLIGNQDNYLMNCGITTSYNTGWMHGDIKGAWLSDTSTASVTGTELVTNGDFATSTLTSYTQLYNCSLSVVSNQLRVTSTAATGYCEFYIGISDTTKYHYFSFQFVGASGITQFGIYASSATGYVTDANAGWSNSSYGASRSAGTYTLLIPPGNSIVGFVFGIASLGQTWTFDNISLRKVTELDRSVNARGLAVYGTITKTAVATGSNLVAYSGFSASNYLQQPQNTALDFGTGDFSIMFWGVMVPLTGTYKAFEITYASAATNLFMDGLGLAITIGGNNKLYQNTSSNNIGWSHQTIVRRSGILYYYSNARLIASTTSTESLVTNSSSTLRIGEGFNQSLTLFRISASVPSPTQIAKIYNDEKMLFQENSQCTLYGSSDAVTALAYDDSNSLLSVGTSSGRSDFRGLERINNTTTAVTTAISASNGLIAEQ